MRISVEDLAPAGYQAVLDLNRYVEASLDLPVLALLKLRASIINGCGYCVDMHSAGAVQRGESSRRLFAVAAWRDAPFFDARERAALALTDAVTRLDERGVPDDVWHEATTVWSPRELADLLLAIATINVWNRIAVTTQMRPSMP